MWTLREQISVSPDTNRLGAVRPHEGHPKKLRRLAPGTVFGSSQYTGRGQKVNKLLKIRHQLVIIAAGHMGIDDCDDWNIQQSGGEPHRGAPVEQH
jgi:hypothetical protein